MRLANRIRSWLARIPRPEPAAPAPASNDALLRDLVQYMTASKWFMVDRLEQAMPQPSSRQCPLCKHAGPGESFAVRESHCRFGGGRLIRHACPDCGVIFGPSKMFALSEDELAEEYRWLYRFYREANSVENEIRTFHHLAPRRDGVYLNFGAGAWSSSIAKLRGEGWNIFGFEPFADQASEFVIRDWDQLRAMRFDGIMSNNLLEHLTDPIATFRLWRGILNGPNATMAHSTPCFEYLYAYTRFHLFFFTGRSMDLICDETGFTGRKVQQDGEYICHRFDDAVDAGAARRAGKLPAGKAAALKAG